MRKTRTFVRQSETACQEDGFNEDEAFRSGSAGCLLGDVRRAGLCGFFDYVLSELRKSAQYERRKNKDCVAGMLRGALGYA